MKNVLVAVSLLGLLLNMAASAVVLYCALKSAGQMPAEVKKLGRQAIGCGLADAALLALVLTTM